MFFCRDCRDCRAGFVQLTPVTPSLQSLQKYSSPYTVPTTPHKCLCCSQGAVLAANLCLLPTTSYECCYCYCYCYIYMPARRSYLKFTTAASYLLTATSYHQGLEGGQFPPPRNGWALPKPRIGIIKNLNRKQKTLSTLAANQSTVHTRSALNLRYLIPPPPLMEGAITPSPQGGCQKKKGHLHLHA